MKPFAAIACLYCAALLSGCRGPTRVYVLDYLASAKASERSFCAANPDACKNGKVTQQGRYDDYRQETYSAARRNTLREVRRIATNDGRVEHRTVIEVGDQVFIATTKCRHKRIEQALSEMKTKLSE